jgi:protein-tyrosine kinase
VTFDPTNHSMVAFSDPDSPTAERYRKLKTIILQKTRQEFRNTILVTSAVSGEGKSVTSANLAIMLAREYGQTVLLIDGDLRRPCLEDYLGLATTFGLADCLNDGIDAGKAIVKTGLPKLSFLSAGKKVTNPAEHLSSMKMKEFLAEVKHRYQDRYIIIDSSPVLLFAETQALTTMVDGVIAVVKEGVASLQDVRDMLDILKGASVLAIVYNDVSPERLDGNYYRYEKHYKRYQENR